MGIYDFQMKDAEGNAVDLSGYRGKVLLIVNTATRCGLTPQLRGFAEAVCTIYRRRLGDFGFSVQPVPRTGSRKQRRNCPSVYDEVWHEV